MSECKGGGTVAPVSVIQSIRIVLATVTEKE